MPDAVSGNFGDYGTVRFYNDDAENRSKVGKDIGESGVQFRKPHETDGFVGIPPGQPNSVFSK